MLRPLVVSLILAPWFCAARTVVVPHVAGNGWTTTLRAFNPSATSRSFTYTPYSDGGEAGAPTAYTVPGLGAVELASPGDLSGEGSGRVETKGAIDFTLRYRYGGSLSVCDFTLSEASATGWLLPNPDTDWFAWVGVALVNPNSAAATVTLRAYKDGKLAGTKAVALAAQAKTSALSDELWGLAPSGLDWMHVESDLPVPSPIVISGTASQDRHLFVSGTPISLETPPVTGAEVSLVLGSPTASSVVASVVSSADLEGYIEYGTSAGSFPFQTSLAQFPANTPVAVAIEGLQPDTGYVYRFREGSPGGGQAGTEVEGGFHTQRPPGGAFAFTVQADPHVGDEGFVDGLYRRTLANVVQDGPDFHIDLGDTFLTEKLAASVEEEVPTFLAHRPYFGVTGPSVPLFLVNGNHEGELGWARDGTADSKAARSTLNRRKYYPCPAPGGFYSGSATVEQDAGVRDGYYAWSWGDALFVVLDPYWYTAKKPNGTKVDNWGWTLGKDQYDWLRRTLENSAAKFKFVFTHHLTGGVNPEGRGGAEAVPYYEWGGLDADGSPGFAARRPGWAMPVHDLLKASGVCVVFHGHDHVFVKQSLDGIVYQECPRPSFNQADAASDASSAGYLSGDILPSPGHLRVSVAPAETKVEFVRSSITGKDTNGSVVYSYTVLPPSGALSPSFTFSPSQPEAGQAVKFTDTSGGSPTSWKWDFGDGGASALQNPTHAYAATGAFTASLTVGNAAGSNTVTRQVPVSVAQSGAFPGTVVLGCPTGSSIRANLFSPGSGGEVFVEYGTSSGTYPARTPTVYMASDTPVEISIEGLSSDAQYYYRTCFRASGATGFTAGPERRFHTARQAGEAFTFCLQGDSHPERLSKQFDPDLYDRTLLAAASDDPDFYLLLGDDFSVDTLDPATVDEAKVRERYTIQRPHLGLVGRSSPLFLVNGNHEQAARYLLNGTPECVAVWAQNARNSLYSQPAPDGFYSGNCEIVPHIGLLRNYFAWTWGDALFVAVDPYWGSSVCVDNPFFDGPKNDDMWDVTLGDAQYQWLKTTLEESRAKYKFVFAHHVSGTGRGGVELAGKYEWGGQNNNGTWGFTAERPTWDQPVHQLMAANGVTVFFQGHDHVWVRQEKDGVIYQTLSEPADPFYALYNADAFSSDIELPNTGYTRVAVSPAGVRVDYVRTYLQKDERPGAVSGSVAYTYSIP